MDIPNRIKELAKARGWSEYRLAKETKLAASTISNIYHRDTIPSVATIEIICDAFGISLSQFFSNDDMISLNEEQAELLDLWSKIPLEQKEKLLELMRSMKLD